MRCVCLIRYPQATILDVKDIFPFCWDVVTQSETGTQLNRVSLGPRCIKSGVLNLYHRLFFFINSDGNVTSGVS